MSSGHTMEDAEFAECASGTPDALFSAAEQAKINQGYVVADDMAATLTKTQLARSLTLVR